MGVSVLVWDSSCCVHVTSCHTNKCAYINNKALSAAFCNAINPFLPFLIAYYNSCYTMGMSTLSNAHDHVTSAALPQARLSFGSGLLFKRGAQRASSFGQGSQMSYY